MTTQATTGEERRFLFLHKHGTSARTRFLRFANGSVLFPEPLPALSQPQSASETLRGKVETHPALLLQQLATALGVTPSQLALESEFNEWVEIPAGVVRIYLVGFTTIDPPFDLAERLGATFIDLTQARGMSATELFLLRRAYETVMEG